MAQYDVFSLYSGFGGQIGAILGWAIPSILVLFVAVFIIYKYRENKIYRLPVTIFSEREGNIVSERETRGGFVTRKGGTTYFVIKQGGTKKREFINPPQLEGMSNNNRLYYYQKDVDTYVQLRRQIDGTIVNFIPIESDIKYGAILSIQRIKEVLRKENKLEKLIAPMTIIVGLVIIMVMFYMLLDKFNPNLMATISENMVRTSEALARAKAGG